MSKHLRTVGVAVSNPFTHDELRQRSGGPLLESELVQPGHWLTARDFMVAVAAGILTAGPVMAVVPFAGYLVAGLPGVVI